MKSLIQFIKESLVNESASDYLLLKTYDDAEKYFTQVVGLKKLEDWGLKLKDIERIYDIANENEKHKKPAPFVGRYKSNKVFAMRRWVYSKLDEWRKRSGNDKIQPEWFWTKIHGFYAGPHNTNLKEDGSYIPSAEDMEVIIAFAFNKMLDEKSKEELDDVKNIKFCANDKSKEQTQKEENMLNYYADEKDIFLQKCAEELLKYVKDKLHKLPSKDEPTSDWENIGAYKDGDSANNTPKTDLISSDRKHKISLKKAHGAQLMSGAYNEAKATILFAAQDSNLPEEDYEKLLTLLDKPWAKLKGKKGIRELKAEGNTEIEDYETLVGQINTYLKDITENKKFKKFKKALLIEAASGKHKFKKGSDSIANCVFVWGETDNKFYSSIEDYVDSIIDNVKIEIRWKTNNYSYQALRIETK